MTKFHHSIFDEVQKKLRQFSDHEILAKSSVFISSTLESINWNGDFDKHYEPRVVFYDKSKDTLLRLALISYEVPKELSFYLRTAIMDITENRIDLSEVRFILQSEINKNCWLRDLVESKTGNQIFGNFLNVKEWQKTLQHSFRIKRSRTHKRNKDPKPVKRTIGVGYKDKGTLPNSTSPGSLSDLCLTSVQNRIEENRQAVADLDKILEGFFW